MPTPRAPKNERAWFFVCLSTKPVPPRLGLPARRHFFLRAALATIGADHVEGPWLFSMTSSVAAIG